MRTRVRKSYILCHFGCCIFYRSHHPPGLTPCWVWNLAEPPLPPRFSFSAPRRFLARAPNFSGFLIYYHLAHFLLRLCGGESGRPEDSFYVFRRILLNLNALALLKTIKYLCKLRFMLREFKNALYPRSH